MGAHGQRAAPLGGADLESRVIIREGLELIFVLEEYRDEETRIYGIIELGILDLQ